MMIRTLATASMLAVAMLYFLFPAWAEPATWEREGWRTDFELLSVDPSEILSGGPSKDGIPPIDRPEFVSVSDVSDLTDRDPVIGLEIAGDARAYPLRVMTWHEIVNDTVGGRPVAVTYCPLCNAAIVFDANIDGKPHTFGTTGKLRNSDLIMYDRATESWWQQFTGTAIAGVHMGTRLNLLPARLESWSEFRKRHPDGKVLVPNNPGMRPYGRNPYVNYDISARPFLFRGELPKDIPAMARVVVVRREGDRPPLIVAMDKVRNAGTLEAAGLKLHWREGQASALHDASIAQGREVGTILVEKNQAAGGGAVPYDVTFAFVAHAFYPQVEIRQ